MIGSSENRVSYDGNGIATEFAYTFKILEKSDMNVLHVAEDGTETLLTKDYYVDMEKSVVLYPGYAPGSEIPESERPPILPVGERLVLYIQVPITQESALDKHWPFKTIEDGLDKLTIICQQLLDASERGLRVSVALDTSNVDTTLPWGPDQSFTWSEDGKKIVLTENPAKVIPVVDAKIQELEKYIKEQSKAIADLVASLNSLTREELQKLRDECADYALKAENAALINTRWAYTDERDRKTGKYNYKLDSGDLVLTVPTIVKLNVEE